MLIERLPLHPGRSDVYLDCYWLEPSPQFQTERRRPMVIVCPGGAYRYTSDREAEPVALRFLARGCHAAVLRYSVLTRLPLPTLDLARAVAAVRRRAAERRVDPAQVYACGFSAGGHLAGLLGVTWHTPAVYEAAEAQPEEIRPDGLILGYALVDLETVPRPSVEGSGLPAALLGTEAPDSALLSTFSVDRQVSPRTPPMFIWHTAADPLVPAVNALRLAAALEAQRVPYELHIFQSGGHGLALADDTTDTDGHLTNREAQPWMDMALAWMRVRAAAGE